MNSWFLIRRSSSCSSSVVIHHLCWCGGELAAGESLPPWSGVWQVDYGVTVYESLLVFSCLKLISFLGCFSSNLVCYWSVFLTIVMCPVSSSETPIKHWRIDDALQVFLSSVHCIHLVTVLLLWRDTMIKATHKRKHSFGIGLQFQKLSPLSSWQRTQQQEAGMALESSWELHPTVRVIGAGPLKP